MLEIPTQGRNQTNTARGSALGRMSTTYTLTGRWCVGAALGVACAQVMKATIYTVGAIPPMGGKYEVQGGKGFHDVFITKEGEIIGGSETT